MNPSFIKVSMEIDPMRMEILKAFDDRQFEIKSLINKAFDSIKDTVDKVIITQVDNMIQDALKSAINGASYDLKMAIQSQVEKHIVTALSEIYEQRKETDKGGKENG